MLLFEEIECEMLVGEEALCDCDHEAEVEGVGDAHGG